MSTVVIIGAGVAGLACARRLTEAGVQAVLFDKGRGIGGRVATRRVGALQFDHGAQYVTARDAGFAGVLADGLANGDLGYWSDGAGKSHVVGTPGMSALAQVLGSGLDVRLNTTVERVFPDGDGWLLRFGASEYRAERVVITVPAPQVAGLIGADHPMVGPLRSVQLAPCLTLMAAIDAPAPFISRSDAGGALAWIAQDSTKPGRIAEGVATWVAQAGLQFSEENLELDLDALTKLMVPLLCERLGTTADCVRYAAAHRWRFARVTAPLGQPFLRSSDAKLYLGGDWCLGPRIEAAWGSGTAIANDILGQVA